MMSLSSLLMRHRPVIDTCRPPRRLAAAWVIRAFALGLIVGAVGGASRPADAYDVNPRQYGYSTDPLRKIGKVSAELSKLCRLGQFNQRRVAEYYTAFGGESRNILGIAKQNYNLYDPSAKADPTKTYHFQNDGTSQCKVFVAP